MKAVLQRVTEASVSVNNKVVGSIGNEVLNAGYVVLLGVETGDTERESTYLAQKTVELRLFADDVGKMNKSLLEVGGAVLLISQFTLIADWRKGRRPGFTHAATPDEGEKLYLHFAQHLRNHGVHVELGVFGADMQVSLVNDGPVTLIIEARPGN